MKSIEEKVINFIARYGLIGQKENLLIAFSGGPDSVFALHFFYKFRKKFRCNISAVHFNHNLRGNESKEDENFAIAQCKKLRVDLNIIQLDVKAFAKKNKLSLEEAARILRYNELSKFAKRNSIDKIITAHNLNDNTETILMNLFSGTGISGLSGIPIKRENIIRPLLCLTKKEILQYLNHNKINYRIDSSNLENDFKRNFIRNKILPLIEEINPSFDDALFRSSQNFLKQKEFENKSIEYLIQNFSKQIKNGYELSLDLLKIYDEIPGEFLKFFLKKYFDYQLEHKDYIKINKLAFNQKGKSIALKNYIKVIKESDTLVFTKKIIDNIEAVEIKIGESKKISEKTIKIESTTKSEKLSPDNYELIAADNLDDTFIIRNWKIGDKFKPLGMKKEKNVSDFLTDLKIPAAVKKEQLVMINRNQIIWIVGLRISDDVKITSETKKVIKLWIK
ncbi:MAG: tRNA lysidine(34) synthetase TilS [Ignavibacteriales bacterium]|nr:tRNA lysidine(34) synthetase TilS [Ignavibacteriales bacterium]